MQYTYSSLTAPGKMPVTGKVGGIAMCKLMGKTSTQGEKCNDTAITETYKGL